MFRPHTGRKEPGQGGGGRGAGDVQATGHGARFKDREGPEQGAALGGSELGVGKEGGGSAGLCRGTGEPWKVFEWVRRAVQEGCSGSSGPGRTGFLPG